MALARTRRVKPTTHGSGRTAGLKFDPHNARLHPERNKQVIRDSLAEVGPLRSIGVDGDGVVRAGNGVLEQAQALGLLVRIVDASPNELIAVRRKDLKGQLAERAALLDNRAGELAEWDPVVLAALAKSNPEALAGLWSEKEMTDLLSSLLEESAEEKQSEALLLERAQELLKKWKVQRGDMWLVPSITTPGQTHRIMCGDSLAEKDLDRLLAGSQAVLSFTSPPYWIGKDFEKERSIQEIEAFIHAAAASMARATRRDESRIVINSGTSFTTSFDKRKKRNTLLLIDKWANELFALGWNLRHIRHWLKSGQADHPLSPTVDLIDQRSEYLETFENDAGKPIKFDDTFNTDEVDLIETFFNPEGKQRGQERTGKASNKWKFKSYWDDIPGVARQFGHPTSFPVELARRHIVLYTKRGEVVIDIFLGAATTIVAAEKTGRLGYGMELDPKYAAVALERLQNLGLKPRLEKGKAPSAVKRANPMKAR